MIRSSQRKLILCGWLKANGQQEYAAMETLQAFLFLYEASANADEVEYDFFKLSARSAGLMFDDVFDEYTNNRMAFDAAVEAAYAGSSGAVDAERASKALFVLRTMSMPELVETEQYLDLWQAPNENGLSDVDKKAIHRLMGLYTKSEIEDSEVIPVGGKRFVFSKDDVPKLTQKLQNVLVQLSKNNRLHNPVFVKVDEQRLVIEE